MFNVVDSQERRSFSLLCFAYIKNSSSVLQEIRATMTKVTLFALCMSLFSYALLVLESKASGNSLRGGARRPSKVGINEDLPRRLLLKDLAPKEIQTQIVANNHPLNWAHDIFNNPGNSRVADVQDDHDDQTTTTASYIIEFDDNVQDIEGAAKIIANWLGRRPGHVYKQLLYGFSISNIPTSMVAKIASIEGVARVELDDAISLDGELVIARHSDENGNDPSSRFLQERQEIPWGIARVQGGKTYNGTNVVFVIDTGVDLNHPDLNVHPTLCFSLAGDSCNDDNGHGSQYVQLFSQAVQADTAIQFFKSVLLHYPTLELIFCVFLAACQVRLRRLITDLASLAWRLVPRLFQSRFSTHKAKVISED
jgi:hypothetical protein